MAITIQGETANRPEPPKWTIRRATADDAGFVLNSWLKSYNEWRRPEERRAGYWTAHKDVIAALLETSRVLVACDAQAPTSIYGWACGQPGTPTLLHYLYVKRAMRHAGVARALVAALLSDPRASTSVVVTHITSPEILGYAKARGWGRALNMPFYAALARKAG